MSKIRLQPTVDGGLDTTSIQAAIDAAHGAGGGRVVLSAGGIFTSGTLELRSRVELHLEIGAVLRASSERRDYVEVDVAGAYGGASGGFLLQASEAELVVISGHGTIDCQGAAFMDGWWTEDGPWIRKPQAWRPRGIGLFGCQQVRILDVTIRNAAQWTLHLTGCQDVLVQGISIYNALDVPNCDGIDPDHCRDVRIIGCHIEAGDDGIVLKNTSRYAAYGPSENILIEACSIVSTSAGIKIGTESCGDFRNVIVRGCTITRSHRGLAIQLRDSGTVENILFCDCIVQTRLFHTRWWGSGEPISVTAVPRHDGQPPGQIRSVCFRNILCEGENGVVLIGTAEQPLRDIVLDQIRLTIRHRSRWPGGRRDLRPMHGQEHGGLEQAPTVGFLAEHVDGLRLRDCSVQWQGEAQSWWGEDASAHEVRNLHQRDCSFSLASP